MLYRYVKSTPTSVPAVLAIMPKVIPMLLIFTGMALILMVAGPILYYELITSPKLNRAGFLSPLPFSLSVSREMSQVAGASTYAIPTLNTSPKTVDYTQLSNWFPTVVAPPNPSKITHFNLSIPKLHIQDAIVAIGGNDLSLNLIQYPGTASPGEFGAPVIFGHSILRQFYNPSLTNPHRYLSIFSTVMTLDTGDAIFIDYDGIRYTYKVSDKYEVASDNLDILRQNYDRRNLRLITCVPEGTYLRRGVLEAQLVES